VDGGAGASGGGTAGAAGGWDLNLECTAELPLQLFDADRQLLQTRRGAWGTMRALHLDPGTDWVMRRGGDAAQYRLHGAAATVAEEGYEREPNDRREVASPMGRGDQVRGELWAQDIDFFRLEVEGDAQRYRLQAVGKGVEELELYDAGGSRLARITG